MMNLDEAAERAVNLHRTRRLSLYLEAILADYCQHHGVAKTREVLRWWDEHLKEFG